MTAFHTPTGREGRAIAASKGITDNQGNSFLLNKMTSTRFPLNAILIQAATNLEVSGQWLDLQWVSREDNKEADALTNLDYKLFDAHRRIEVGVDSATFPVLFYMLKEGRQLYENLEEQKRENRVQGVKRQRVALEDKLKSKDPW